MNSNKKPNTRILNFSACAMLLSLVALTACGRNIRTAQDVTPGHEKETRLDWKYGAMDIKIQTSQVTNALMNRWWAVAKEDLASKGKARIIITDVDNRTDQFISTAMIRDVIEEVAVDDGRFSVVVGDSLDEKELDRLLEKSLRDPKYDLATRPQSGVAKAPQFLAKIRLTKAITHQKTHDLEHYRFSITLYDIETQEAVDTASDTLYKKISL